MKFDWDEFNEPKCTARVPKDEIEALFANRSAVISRDPTTREERYRAAARNRNGRPLFIVFTMRLIGGEWRIRPVSARYAHEKEARKWESL